MAYTQADYLDYFDEVLQPIYRGGSIDKKHFRVWLTERQDIILGDNVENFSPQFFGESFLGIVVNDYVASGAGDSTQIAELLTKMNGNEVGATNLASRLLIPRTYSTYCPAVIGYDPFHEITLEDSNGIAHDVGFFAEAVFEIGGTASWSNRVRDSSFVPYSANPPTIVLHTGLHTASISYNIEATGNNDAVDSDKTAYTTSNCFSVETFGRSFPVQHPSDLKVYLILCYQYQGYRQYCMKWVVYSEQDDFIYVSGAGVPLFSEPTDDDDEGDEPEVIDFPVPTPNYAVASGMVKVYRLTLSDCQALASDMWNENWWSQTGHWFGENPPYEAVSSLGVVPYAPDNGATLSWNAKEDISLAGHPLPTADGYPVTQTTYFTDFNSMAIPTEYGGSFLDYEPYTTVQALLPFIGWVNLPAQFVVGHTVSVRYIIDVISGGVNVFIKNETTGVFAMHSGSCLYNIPVGTAEGGRLFDGIMAAATAGVSLSTGTRITATKGMDALKVAQHAFDTTVTMRGSASGNMGYCASGNIYLYVHRPNVLDYDQYAPCVGYPTARYMQLSTCQGFTQIDSVNLAGLPATKPEIERFESMLKSGIVIPAPVSQPATSVGTTGRITLDLYTRTGCIHELNTSGSTTTRFSAVQGAFRQGDNPTLSNPSIVIEKPFSDVSLVNYVHITEFNRFYYVEDAVALTNNTTMLVLSSDVLNSFWDSAKDSWAYIARQENTTWARNEMIDEKVVTGCLNGETVSAYEITNPYQGAHQYIVVCAGAT